MELGLPESTTPAWKWMSTLYETLEISLLDKDKCISSKSANMIILFLVYLTGNCYKAYRYVINMSNQHVRSALPTLCWVESTKKANYVESVSMRLCYNTIVMTHLQISNIIPAHTATGLSCKMKIQSLSKLLKLIILCSNEIYTTNTVKENSRLKFPNNLIYGGSLWIWT